MLRRTKMLSCMAVLRVVAATHVSTGPAYPQMDPRVAKLEAFLAAARAWSVGTHRVQMVASLGHDVRYFGFLGAEFTLLASWQIRGHVRAARRLWGSTPRRSPKVGKSGGFDPIHGGMCELGC
jgi:hypothetical protein